MNQRLILGILAVLAVTACGKQVELLNNLKNGNVFNIPAGPACQLGDRLHWQWHQPGPTVNHTVDLLFVVDTSLSLMNERTRLANAIPHFLTALPADADIRIAVMLAHGTSCWSGKLYSNGRTPAVIDPRTLSLGDAQKALHDKLSCPPLDIGVGNGEMMLYSLQKGLETDHFAESRSQGFFRDGAALSVVFVTDENDICYFPPDHGYKTFPDYNEHGAWLEKLAYDKYCVNNKGTLTVTPESVMANLQSRMPGRKITLAGIVHTDSTNVDSCGEDSIGHGIIETVAQSPDGSTMDIKSGDFEGGLRNLASVSTSQLALMTSFPLNTQAVIDPTSILVSVDGRVIGDEFEPQTQSIQIAGVDAGGAFSQIDVSACPASR